MDHSFIYTTEKVENCPKQLYCGFEIIDGMLKTINIMPGRNEYLMGEDKLNPEFDLTKLTADCFSASVEIKDEKNTVLTVTIEDPTLTTENHDTVAFTQSSNLQILDDGSHVYLETLIRKSLIDPRTFPNWIPPVEEEEETAEEQQ